MPSLFVIRGRDRGHRYNLADGPISIGRGANSDVRLHDTEVSRRHAEIRRNGSGCQLLDLGSSNGSFVNGDRVTQHELKSGDQVLIGRTLMLFTGGDPDSASATASVDIVKQGHRDDSQIVRTMTREEGSRDIFSPAAADGESPWLARARSNLEVMYRTALAVSHTLDIQELLDRIMLLIFEWVEADRGCIMLLNNETEELEPKVRRNRSGKDIDEKITISKTILDYVLQNNEGVLTSNARDDSRWDTGASIVSMGVREAICAPMRGRYGVVGAIYIDTFTEPHRVIQQGGATKFSEEHLKLMIAIAHQAALAVEDTSYYSAMVDAERLAAVGQTIATLSHHIKNILQGIRGGSFLIEMGLSSDDNEVVKKGWGIVEKNQGRISNLVMDMLSFSKEREPDLVLSDLNQVVDDVVELMESRAMEYQVQLNWQPSERLPQSMFDPEGMHRAILNVATNAIDACESRSRDATDYAGQVDVSTKYDEAGRLLRVVICDNGGGIAPEDIKQMFNIFVSKKGSRGTGLGLPVSQKILTEHGGRILVDSEVGVGSRFALELPLIEEPPTGSDMPNLPSPDDSDILDTRQS
ncbi:MAG: FHA domain-containing protein [Planctomycetota bacterium]|nr:MAG: FHA domain-containing protein [Planctomycetota bacterium]